MKKILFYILLVITMLSGACKKLDEQPYSVLSAWTKPSDIESAIVGIYQGFFLNGWEQTLTFLTMQEVGHQYSSYGSFGDGYKNDPYYTYQLTNQESSLLQNWQMLYTVINRANEIIDGVPAVISNTAEANVYIAEAKCLRGWAYFMLTQFWGKVPLHVHPTQTLADPSAIFKPNAPVESIYELVESDLKFAAQYLPNVRPTGLLGRVTRASALGLLGKAYLTMAGRPLNKQDGFQKSVSTFAQLEELIRKDSIPATLLENYADIFSVNNEMNKEILFAFRGSANTSSQANGTIWPWLWVSYGMCPTTNGNFQAHMYGLRWDIMRMYEPEDIRLKDGIGAYYDNLADPAINGALDTMYYDTLALFCYRSKSDPGKTVGGTNMGLGYTKWRSTREWVGYSGGYQKDFIVLRYADVLLCYAEALNETGQTEDALDYLNRVRDRVGASEIPNSHYVAINQTAIRAAIRDERRRELVGEGTTIMDIRRWGTLQEEMSGMRQNQFTPGRILPVYQKKFEIYPIPFSEITGNPQLIQNEGWE